MRRARSRLLPCPALRDGCFLRLAKPMARRSEAQEAAALVDGAQRQIAEADDVAALVALVDGDELAGEGIADEVELAVPLDVAIAANPADLSVINGCPGGEARGSGFR
jgi:hypothetical protein